MFYDEDEPAYGYCDNCEQDVDVIREDWGIGQTEFWGAISTHHDYVYTCAECGGIVEDLYI